jgi:hypothetical protein
MAAERQEEQAPTSPTDADVDAAIAESGGDARETVRMLLSDLDVLARDHNASVSHGYVYGRLAVVCSRAGGANE